MRSMLDSEFDDMHGVDVFRRLDSFCLQADARDASERRTRAAATAYGSNATASYATWDRSSAWGFASRRAASRRCSSFARGARCLTNRFALVDVG